MNLLRFILIFSLVFNLFAQVSITCNMKACKIFENVTTCCKKDTVQKNECCCVKMKCKVNINYNNFLTLVDCRTLEIQHDYLARQDVLLVIDKETPFVFYIKYFYRANPPSKNNIPLLT